MNEKRTLTPAEFAAQFGREKTWTYRLLYKGKITGITEYGRLMIPASEAARIEGDAGRYRGKKTAAKKAAHVETPPPKIVKPAKGTVAWGKWREERHTASQKPGGGVDAAQSSYQRLKARKPPSPDTQA